MTDLGHPEACKNRSIRFANGEPDPDLSLGRGYLAYFLHITSAMNWLVKLAEKGRWSPSDYW